VTGRKEEVSAEEPLDGRRGWAVHAVLLEPKSVAKFEHIVAHDYL
jgi:hypothetical protein